MYCEWNVCAKRPCSIKQMMSAFSSPSKTNPTPTLLKILFSCGLGGEVVSRTEYALCRQLGLDPKKIIANGCARDEEWLKEVIRDEVALINLNGFEDFEIIINCARQLKLRPRVGLRISAGGWSGQFGEPARTAVALVQKLACSQYVEWVGLQFHNGPLLRNLGAVADFIGTSFKLC